MGFQIPHQANADTDLWGKDLNLLVETTIWSTVEIWFSTLNGKVHLSKHSLKFPRDDDKKILVT